MRNYWVYILANDSRSTLYVGVTSDLSRRVSEHRSHAHADSFTARYNVGRLVYFERFASIELAILREKQIKRWRRSKKIGLIESQNPAWDDLYKLS